MDDYERAKELKSLFQGLYEDRVVRELEESLDLFSKRYRLVFDPNTEHPAFSHAAGFVRDYNRDHVIISMSQREPGWLTCGDPQPEVLAPYDRLVLIRKKYVAPAPYVGERRARYVWSVWLDDKGRHVAGDSELIWDDEC